jgi:methylthioribose-1-phosphate isomerase
MKLNQIDKAILVWGPVSKEGLTYLKEQKELVVISENRPYMIGLRHNKPLLEREGIRFVYCTDNMLGILFYKKKVKEALLFYEKKEEGKILAICGSLYFYLLAKLHNVAIKFFLQEKIDFLNKDASCIDGLVFVSDKDKIIKPEKEWVELQ